jgi:sulfite dehydrogenase (quinone) subunit SoeC
MHPALSVIAFTTLSGAGYGLLVWLGWLIPFHRLPLPQGYAPLALVVAGVLVTAGLLSSLGHLGRPERAWRAFSQWRTSWLSREGVLAVATYVPLLAMFAATTGWIATTHARWLGPVLIVLALLTTYATSMIYASLRTVAAWRLKLVPALYLVHALSSGCLLAVVMLSMFLPGERLRMPMATAFVMTLIAWSVQWAYWRRVDGLHRPRAATAVALKPTMRVHPFEQPHSEDSFVTREMVFRFARERARPLRRLGLLSAAATCPIAIALGLAWPGLALPALVVAAILQFAGIFVSRWLFFAEARHAVAVYYDVDARR